MEAISHASTVKSNQVVKVNNNKRYLISKRIIDIIGSILGLIFLSPIFLIVAIFIKIEDPKGPIFFMQMRIGKDGKEFSMLKFRSMVSNAEELLESLLTQNEVSGAMFKMKKDPRVTRIGKIIRKTSIDELPQLINVLKGEMSLVGPRPPLPREVTEYTNYQKQRLLVQPGCTGVWQVSARNSVGFEEMVEMDITYIAERSLWMDVTLIVKTIFVVVSSKNAY
ncbi:sugar transferase [Bacillus idriensis]|uniref:Sugar transferase n=1 Tax=Metabacillus idriensis TaxID=324768 RepID=A0A6I2MCW8_9BACI|nr:sugar transferase [Metabacillus idriensis]MRX54251.1 sugar transferase [Metabacillus idriensis]